jgi:hypothetical protein
MCRNTLALSAMSDTGQKQAPGPEHGGRIVYTQVTKSSESTGVVHNDGMIIRVIYN